MITLLSDWKLRDPYIGIFKGQLLSLVPNAQIVDITHNLEMYNLSQTAFVAKNSYKFFPEKTVHIILSGLSFSYETKPVLVLQNGHFFLSEDTGVFSMMFGMENNKELFQYEGDMSLSVTEKLAIMASWVLREDYAKHTVPCTSLKFQISMLSEPDYNPERKIISGKIAYIDSCCNAITNIPVSMFEQVGKKTFKAKVGSYVRPLKITKYHSFYNPKEQDVFLMFNRLGFIEVTQYEGNIAALADIMVGNDIEIDFS